MKSELKKLLDEVCPEVFTEAGEEDIVFPVVVEDSVVALRRWGHTIGRQGANQVGIDTLVEYIFREALLHLKRTKCYIALFDKARCVTLAKEPEQAKRDVGAASQPPPTLVPQNSPKFGATPARLLTFSALEWGRVVNDRTSRNKLIREIGNRAAKILPERMQVIGVPADHFLVIDFEGFDGESMQLPLLVYPNTTELAVSVPPPPTCTSSTFRNNLGEFDVAALHYLYNPAVWGILATTPVESGQTAAILLKSIDTDMLPITVLNLSHNQEVRVESTLTKPSRNVFFNPAKLATWLSTLGGVDSDENIDEFVRMYIIAGSDFVQSCPGLSNYTAMKTYVRCRAQGIAQTPENVLEVALQNGLKASGTKRASTTAARCSTYDLGSCSARSHWCVNYWKHSVNAPEKLFASPLGRGFSLKGTGLVYTEDIRNTLPRKKTRI